MGWKNAVGGGLGLGRPSANPGLESTKRQKVIITILMTGSSVDPHTMFLVHLQGVPKKTHFQNCVGYVKGPIFLVILVILKKHHCSYHFRPLLVFLVILAHFLVNSGLFGYFPLSLVILVIFGYFWLF